MTGTEPSGDTGRAAGVVTGTGSIPTVLRPTATGTARTGTDAADLIAEIRQLAEETDPAGVRQVVADVLSALDRVASARLRGQRPDQPVAGSRPDQPVAGSAGPDAPVAGPRSDRPVAGPARSDSVARTAGATGNPGGADGPDGRGPALPGGSGAGEPGTACPR